MTSPFVWPDVQPGQIADGGAINLMGAEVERLGLSLTGVFPLVGIVKPTDGTPKNNDAALADDPVLKLPMSINSSYICWTHAVYSSATTADLQYAFTRPSGATFASDWSVLATNAAGAFAYSLSGPGPNSVGGVGVGVNTVLDTWGRVANGANAGNLQFQWAQAAAIASDTFVRAGSFMILLKIPT